jgi:hypothetical protein
MNISASLRWALLLTVGASLLVFLQDEEAVKATGQGAQGARVQLHPKIEATGEAELQLPDPQVSEWPRRRLGSDYGWEPVPAPPAPAPKVVTPSPPPVLASESLITLAPTAVQPLILPAEPEPPPKPKFPYQMVGLLEGEKMVWAWLVGANGTRAVVQNELLDDSWRVEAIGPGGMSVRHLKTDYALQITYKP